MNIRNRSQPTMFYRYRPFAETTLEALCDDTMHFAHPGTFNDPLDCNPTLECDSNIDDLRKLVEYLVRTRISAEVRAALADAQVQGANADRHARKRAEVEATRTLTEISYHATNPEYSLDLVEAETWLLTQEAEGEVRRYYERGVCCLSTAYSSPILWSHYGDQHRGICIGYGTDRNPKPHPQPVTYGGSRAVRTSALVRAFVQSDGDARDNLDRSVLLSKAKGWSHEREWRLIGPEGVQDSPLLLKEIIFGQRCSRAVMHSVVTALQGRSGIEFYEMYVKRGQFTMSRQTLDTDDLSRNYPRTAQSGVEMFPAIEEEGKSGL
jgi:Protein of unknown function (DUF2971)